MCGLYSFRTAPEEARALFGYVDRPNFPPRPYIRPTEPAAIVARQGDERRFRLVRWGLVPSWAREIRPGRPLINARAETVVEKPSFRAPMKRRRCLVPADGFYEWRGEPGRKQAFFIHRRDQAPFAFAGIWDHWLSGDGSELDSMAIITTTANATVAPIHDRMPVILDRADYAAWLDVDAVSAAEAAGLLKPAGDDVLVAEPTVIARTAKPPPAQPKLI